MSLKPGRVLVEVEGDIEGEDNLMEEAEVEACQIKLSNQTKSKMTNKTRQKAGSDDNGAQNKQTTNSLRSHFMK